MKDSTQVIGLPLISIKEGLECGVVQDILMNPETNRIKSLIIQGLNKEYDFRELDIADIVGIGKDYVITQSAENAAGINRETGNASLLKMRCISASGDVLGNVNEFSFNEKTGEIHSLQTDAGAQINGALIISFSNDLLFVNVEDQFAPFAPTTEQKAAPAPVAEHKPIPAPEKPQGGGSYSSLMKEQSDYLLGRTVKNDIRREDGSVIIQKGTQVTQDTIALAEKAGVMIDLTLEAE